MDDAVLALIADHDPYLKVNDAGKIECVLNGHAMPARADAIQAFVNGAKFNKLAKADKEAVTLIKYEPFLVQSKNFGDKLFCGLTCQLLTKSVKGVRKHMKGHHFQAAKERYTEDAQELMEEPPLRSRPNASEEQASDAAEPSEASGDGAGGGGGGGDEDDDGDAGMWVPDEYRAHEARATVLVAEEAAGGSFHAVDGDSGGDSGTDVSDAEEPVVRAGKSAKRKAAAIASPQPAPVEKVLKKSLKKKSSAGEDKAVSPTEQGTSAAKQPRKKDRAEKTQKGACGSAPAEAVEQLPGADQPVKKKKKSKAAASAAAAEAVTTAAVAVANGSSTPAPAEKPTKRIRKDTSSRPNKLRQV